MEVLTNYQKRKLVEGFRKQHPNLYSISDLQLQYAIHCFETCETYSDLERERNRVVELFTNQLIRKLNKQLIILYATTLFLKIFL